MIGVDISNVWGQLELPDLLALEREVAAAHEALPETDGDAPETERILEAAGRIRRDSEACVVVGMDGSCLAARGAMELLQGCGHNLKKDNPRIFFAGNSFSTRQWNELMELLEGKDFSLIVVSRSGDDVEAGIALRGLRWMLERKYGTDKANRRIYAVTDAEQGALGSMAKAAGWEVFNLASDSALAAALLPMAVAGIDMEAVLQGAREAAEEFAVRSLENPVWQYAAVRNLMHRGGRAVEVLSAWEPGFYSFGRWWQKLFAGAEGKDGKGLFPAVMELPGDRQGLGQLLLHGQRNVLETMVRFAPTGQKHIIGSQWEDPDGLNYLEGRALDQVEEEAWFGAVDAHAQAGVPVITLDCGELEERTVGQLMYFMELSCAISARVLGVVHADAAEE